MLTGPNPEYSFDEPIANSSMFVLPRMTAPTDRRRSVMWASYGATYPSRIREPAVHWPPATLMRSLSATGIVPMSHAQDVALPLRQDAPTEADRHAAFQALAPAVEDGLYLVPRVIE